MKLEFHPETVDDLNDAVEFYEHRQLGLGDDLRQEIYQTIDRILANPLHYREVRGDIRRCLAHRFPFSVLYRIPDEDTIRILVIRHHRQHPDYGTPRQ